MIVGSIPAADGTTKAASLLGIENYFAFYNNSEGQLAKVLRSNPSPGAALLDWPGYPELMSDQNYTLNTGSKPF